MCSVNSSGNASQDARDHDLLLRGEVAAAAVGDMTQPTGDRIEITVVADAGLDPFEVFGDRTRPELARRALSARLDRQEPREAIGGIDHAGRVVVDDEPGRSHAATDRLEALVAHRHVEIRERSPRRSPRRRTPP